MVNWVNDKIEVLTIKTRHYSVIELQLAKLDYIKHLIHYLEYIRIRNNEEIVRTLDRLIEVLPFKHKANHEISFQEYHSVLSEVELLAKNKLRIVTKGQNLSTNMVYGLIIGALLSCILYLLTNHILDSFVIGLPLGLISAFLLSIREDRKAKEDGRFF